MSETRYSDFNPYIIASGLLAIQNCPPAGVVFKGRKVRWYELELMNEVDGGYIITEGEKLYISKGDIFIRKPGMNVKGAGAYGCNSIIFDCIYDRSMEKQYTEPRYDNPTIGFLEHMKSRDASFPILNELPYKINVADYPYFKKLFDSCFECYIKQDTDFQFLSKVILYNLLFSIRNEIKKQGRISENSSTGKYSAVQEAKQYIEQNFNENIGLRELALKAGYNPEFFCRLFKKATGTSPIDYLIDVRLYHAKSMLITTNNPISEIAWACGFKNESHFYTLFKKKEHLSPGKYRDYNRQQFFIS